MRVRIALLVTSWIIGIIAGALSAPLFFIIVCTLLCAGFILLMRVQFQLGVAVLALLLLGYTYGLYDAHGKEYVCLPQEHTQATLKTTYSLTPTQARYVFVRDDGCELLVYAPRFPVLGKGTIAQISGKQEAPMSAFDFLPEYAEFLQHEGISLVVQGAQVRVLQEGNDPLDAFRIQIVSRIETLFREPDASLLAAMLAGDQGMIPRNIKDMYRKSGIIHILSISGLHVSIIAVVLTGIVSIFHASLRTRSVAISVLLWTYIVAVGAPASAVRAGVFWTCYVFAYQLKALIGLLTVLLLTLAILLTVSPGLVGSIGFELSFVAVCGIGIALFFMRRVRMRPLVQGVVTLIAVSAGATIATAPLTLYYFGTISLVGVFANMLIVPLLPFITYLVLLALLFQVFFPALAFMCSLIVHALMVWVLFVAERFATIPYGNFEHISFPAWGIIVYYGLLGAGVIFLMKRLKISWREWWV